jgi:hypothetical protein
VTNFDTIAQKGPRDLQEIFRNRNSNILKFNQNVWLLDTPPPPKNRYESPPCRIFSKADIQIFWDLICPMSNLLFFLVQKYRLMGDMYLSTKKIMLTNDSTCIQIFWNFMQQILSYLFQKGYFWGGIIGLRVFSDINKSWNSNILKSNYSRSQLFFFFFFFQKCMHTKYFKNK